MNDLKDVQVGKDWFSVAQDRGKWRSAWSQHLTQHQMAQQRGQLIGEKNVLCDVYGRSLGERITKHVTSVQQRGEGRCVSRRILCSVRSARGGFTVGVGWWCTDAGERRWWKMSSLLEVWGWASPKDKWSAGSMAEPSADKETSMDTNALMS